MSGPAAVNVPLAVRDHGPAALQALADERERLIARLEDVFREEARLRAMLTIAEGPTT